MAGRTKRSFQLMSASWRLLGEDPKLLLLPLGSFLSVVTIGAVAYMLGIFRAPGSVAPWRFYLGIYVLYAILAFVGICFDSVLVAVALKRLRGEPATIGDGWAMVRERLPKILRWALIAATVGIVLRIIQDKGGILGRVLGIVGSVAWSLITFFVMPVLLFEPIDVRAAIKRSSSIFKARWGEQIMGNVTIGIGALVFLIPLSVFSAVLMLASVPLGIAALVASFVAMVTASAALTDVFNAALYNYATTGGVPPGFTAQDFEGAIKRRKGWMGRSEPAPSAFPPRPDL